MEIEAKFVVPDEEAAARLAEARALAGRPLGAPSRVELFDAYFDTEDRALWAAGYVCRLRVQGDRRLVSVKSLTAAEHGIHRREEHEVHLSPLSRPAGRRGSGSAAAASGPSVLEPTLESPASWPESDARTTVQRAVGERPLALLFVLRQERTIRLVGPEEAPLVELALDRVEISADASTEVWLVAEAELRAPGTEDDLSDIARALRDEWQFVPDHRSKFERAVEALGLQTTAAAGTAATPETPDRPAPAVKPDRLLFDVLQSMPSRPAGPRRAKTSAAAAEPGSPAASRRRPATKVTPVAPPEPTVAAATQEPAVAPVFEPAEEVASAETPRAAGPDEPGAVPAAEEPTSLSGSESESEAPPAEKPKAARRRRKQPKPVEWDRDTLYEAATGKLSDKPGLQPADSMAEAARKTILYHFLRMLRHEEGTRLGDDIEELHDMRVSTRRMRAAFRVFDDHLDPKLTKPFLRGLRATGRTLGAVRDLDVFREKTEHYLGTLPEERRSELDPLLVLWHEEREQGRNVMIRYLDSDEYRQFVVRFGVSLQHPDEWPEAPSRGEVRPSLLRDVVPAVLYERVAEVRAFDAVLRRPDAPLERYHELRIYAKGLRYTLEYFKEVLGSDAKSLIDDIKLLQDHLGDLQDAVVSSGVLRTFLAFGTWSWPKKAPEPAMLDVCTVLAVTQYLLYRQEEADRLVRTFPDVWERIQSPEFSRRVAASVAGL